MTASTDRPSVRSEPRPATRPRTGDVAEGAPRQPVSRNTARVLIRGLDYRADFDAGNEHHMAPKDDDSRSDPTPAETTAALSDDHLDELHDPTSPTAEEIASGLELPTGSALLVVTRGPNAGSRFLLDRDFMTAGRHPDSDILLDDITASRRHAEFRRENGKFRVVDTGSLNGTYINRQPVESAVLANGDKIQIGKFRLVFFAAPATQ